MINFINELGYGLGYGIGVMIGIGIGLGATLAVINFMASKKKKYKIKKINI